MVDSISKQEKAPVWALLFYAGFAAALSADSVVSAQKIPFANILFTSYNPAPRFQPQALWYAAARYFSFFLS
jgi:hypothetical protein